MTPALVFHWDVNPIMVQIGPLAVRWYGVLFATAFLVGSWIMRGIYQREGTDPASLDRLFLYMPVGAVLGARLGHVLLYDPQYYFTHPLKTSRSGREVWPAMGVRWGSSSRCISSRGAQAAQGTCGC